MLDLDGEPKIVVKGGVVKLTLVCIGLALVVLVNVLLAILMAGVFLILGIGIVIYRHFRKGGKAASQ